MSAPADDNLFGTDGVRGRPGEGVLSASSVRRLARAVAGVLARREDFPDDLPAGRGRAVYIGRDTRSSGTALLDQVASVLLECGYGVADLGVLPTPGVAYVASTAPECCLAVVLSASHNPAEDNGIKLVSSRGTKVSEELERAVSRAYRALEVSSGREGAGAAGPVGRRAGLRRDLAASAFESYVDFLVSCCERPGRLRGRRVVLDTAHGAAYRTAPEVFRRLGMLVDTLGAQPDGANINAGCGALYPQPLAAHVVATGALAGFSFDGDADRLIPVTARGTILDGDHVMALAARHYATRGKLPRKTVVATVMSNVGLEKCLASFGLRLRRTPVGDRHVYQTMVEEGHPIGGEQSGHLIFLDLAGTGDGTLAAIRLLDVLDDALDLESEARILRKYPQVLRGVRVREKVPLESIAEVVRAVETAEARLGGEGRVVLRYSGTEPLARVMLEGPEERLVAALCAEICDAIQVRLGR